LTSPTTADWPRLGDLLIRRRIEIDPRYRVRRTFADERGMDYRVVFDLEKHRRTNFEPTTLAAAEQAYRLTPGSIGQALAGGELTPAESPETLPAGEFVDFKDPGQAALWALRRPGGDLAPEFIRRALIAVYRNLSRADAQEYNRAVNERTRRRA